MHRLALLLVVLAACGDDGTPTGAASTMGFDTKTKSSYSKPFTGADGAGNTVLGWKIDFTSANSGTGCKADGVKVVATIDIYTSQTKDSGHSVAELTSGDISITLNSPPTAPSGGAIADMGADHLTNLEGTVSLTGVAKSGDGKSIIGLEGTISVGGLDDGGNGVIMSGTFDAPTCN